MVPHSDADTRLSGENLALARFIVLSKREGERPLCALGTTKLNPHSCMWWLIWR